jgi:hypothetical protein
MLRCDCRSRRPIADGPWFGRPCPVPVGVGSSRNPQREMEPSGFTRVTADRLSAGGFLSTALRKTKGSTSMGGIIYLVGLIVIVMAILSFFGLR